MSADGFVFAHDDSLALLADVEAEAGDEELRAGFGGEERDGVVFGEDDVVEGRERKGDLLGEDVEVVGEPVVLGWGWWFSGECEGLGIGGHLD